MGTTSNSSELKQFCQPRLETTEALICAHAILLPHAGYIYSGDTACQVLSRVEMPSKILLIGPNHWGAGSDFALFTKGGWETPIGRVPVDEDLAEVFSGKSSILKPDHEAHAEEHSLEVIVPMLQVKNPNVRIVPLIVGTVNFDLAREVAKQIGEALQSQPEKVLTVISSDMSHYDPDDVTRKKDRYALDAIEQLDAEALLKAVKDHQVTMCGLLPVYMLLVMKDFLQIKKATLVDYRTSADATGEKDRVVGYAGFIFE